MKISTANYGLCLFDKANLAGFIARNGNPREKILKQLIDNHNLYLRALEEGVFLPIPEIDSIDYFITFDLVPDNNIVKFKYGQFNLNVINNEIWISDIGLLNKSNLKAFETTSKIENVLLNGDIECIAQKHYIENGRYEIEIIGSVDTNSTPCLSFLFSKCNGFIVNDPREYVFEFD
ncbi:hypothetical protein [Pelistega ratti]|uniref:hypothetical protein n=1 Tax=Pelistega ratti TaxID=2652177 RepID=UPI001356B3BD|nr:hypothetical protein [Pelistega ratti]